MSIRVVSGEISAKDATTRAAIPTAAQPRWPPFERVAETIATPRRRFPPHRHEGVEVLTYVIEGSGTYECGSGPPTPLTAHSTTLLTAPGSVSHAINPGKGQTLRWFSVVASLPSGAAAAPRRQDSRAEASAIQADGTQVRRLVGSGAGLASALGLESELVEFTANGAAFRKVGHDRVAVCYALSGRGSVDNQATDAGEAALVDDAGGVAIEGRPGFRITVTTAPRPR